jgi:hypothetical protein
MILANTELLHVGAAIPTESYGNFGLEKPSSEYLGTNRAITTTGVFSHAALIAAIGEVGGRRQRDVLDRLPL